MFRKKYQCAECKYYGPCKTYTPGSTLLELALWCTLVFGWIYSLWRIGARKKVCGQCGSQRIRIPKVKPKK